MFDRFTDRTRKCCQAARMHAVRMNNDYVGTEHLLLGLLSDRESIACIVMSQFVMPDQVEQDLEATMKPAPDLGETSQIPFTPRAKKVFEYAIDEARSLGSDYVGTEHMLIALIRETEGIAGTILVKHGMTHEKVREKVKRFRDSSDLKEKIDSIAAAIRRERAYQDKKWGTLSQHPHTVLEWIRIMTRELEEAEEAWHKKGVDEAMKELLQAVTVGVAAMEQHGVTERDKK